MSERGGFRDSDARRTPVYIICSPRPRLGRTLIARLLAEHFVLHDRSVAAFDLNPNDPVLADFLPEFTTVTAIGDTRDQMTLFDQLIVNDGTPKVVDIAAGLFTPFFGLIQNIGFVEEAQHRGIEPVLLFMIDAHRFSVEAYDSLQRLFPHSLLVPVHNEATAGLHDGGRLFPLSRANGAPMRIPRLSPVLNSIINRPGFSFAAFLRKPVAHPTEIHLWAGRAFVAFRELELRLRMEDFRALFRRP